MLKKNRNYDNDSDNDKLQYFTKTFNFQKYKKMFSRKIRHVAIRSGSIRWISLRFDAPICNDKPFGLSLIPKGV